MSRRRISTADNTGVRLVKLIENSAPNPDRPRGSRRFEKRALDVDRRTATAFASLENLTYKAKKTTQDLLATFAAPRRLKLT